MGLGLRCQESHTDCITELHQENEVGRHIVKRPRPAEIMLEEAYHLAQDRRESSNLVTALYDEPRQQYRETFHSSEYQKAVVKI